MKKIWVYLLGILTGIVLTFIVGFIMNITSQTGDSGIVGANFFEEPGDIIEASSLEVFQALESGTALAHIQDDYSLLALMIYDPNGKPFYDQQVVNLPDMSYCFRQVGIYRYPTKQGEKTVPIVQIMKK